MTTPDPQGRADVDLDDLGRLLRRIEAIGEGNGWSDGDPNMMVYVVYDRHDVVTGDAISYTLARMGEPVRNTRYVAQPMVPPRLFDRVLDLAVATGSDPMPAYEQLRNFAVNIAYAAPGDITTTGEFDGPASLVAARHLLSSPGVVAFAAHYEAWGRVDVGEAEMMTVLTGRKRMVDHPDAKEVRVVLAVDTADQVHRVSRVRHQPTELQMCEPIRGDVSTSLRILMDAACDRLPSLDDHSEHYPTLIEYARRQKGANG